MRNFKLFYIVAILISGLFIASCNKDQNLETSADHKEFVDTRSSSFNPSVRVINESDYLVFNSFSDLDLFLAEANTVSHKTLNSWENENGIISQRQVFYKVMDAETNLDLSLEKLSEKAKIIERAKTPYHSSEHNQALKAGLIRYYGEGAN
ncbi:MAG: hypothetical protein WAU01_03115, partial [Saprospiraceae bacterium]